MCMIIIFVFVFMMSFQGIILAEIKHTSGGSDYCIVDGRPYRSGERIPRDHVCHMCFCHLGKAVCSWMDCPPPPQGCVQFTVNHYCNPALYLCPIPEEIRGVRYDSSLIRLKRNSDITTLDQTTESKTNSNKNFSGDCTILGVPYKTGDLMGIATSFCLECRCGRQNMFCSPRCCFQHVELDENVSLRETAVNTRIPQMHPLHYITTL